MNHPSKLILFNGPRHSGKDEAANYCAEMFGASRFKMSGPIKAAIKAMFSLSYEDVELLETIKTQPSPLLFGRSYVEVQISFSEEWAKQLWSKDVFGKLAARAVDQWQRYAGSGSLFVCSDSGFREEAERLVYQVIGAKNVLLVHLDRPGKTFAGDSRSYIELPSVETIKIENTGTVLEYHDKIRKEVGGWLGLEPAKTGFVNLKSQTDSLEMVVNYDPDDHLKSSGCPDGFCPMPNVRLRPSESMFPPVKQH